MSYDRAKRPNGRKGWQNPSLDLRSIYADQRENNSPAALPTSATVAAGVGQECSGGQQPRPSSAGPDAATGSQQQSARVATDTLTQIEGSNDVHWLRRIMGDRENPLGVRNAAERRLRHLVKKPRL